MFPARLTERHPTEMHRVDDPPGQAELSASMTDFANGRGFGKGDGSGEPLAQALLPKLVWLAGLFSTLYLVGWASLLVFYSVVFSSYLSPDFEWRMVALIGMDAIPLCCFAAIGFMGLKFWPHGRFRLWGLSAILFQTALAVCAYASPEGVLIFSDWLG